jgi:hypothetical protein
MRPPFAEDVRQFIESAAWTFAKTYVATWPHEYVVRTPGNAAPMLALARHIFEHGVEERFYSKVFRYHHEGGKVYWSMAPTPEATDLINRCDEDQTYEARLAAGTLPRSASSRSRQTGSPRIVGSGVNGDLLHEGKLDVPEVRRRTISPGRGSSSASGVGRRLSPTGTPRHTSTPCARGSGATQPMPTSTGSSP